MVFSSGNADSRYVRLISWAGAVVSVNLLAGMISYLIVTLNGDLRLSMIVLGVLTALLAPQLEVMTVQKAWLVPACMRVRGYCFDCDWLGPQRIRHIASQT